MRYLNQRVKSKDFLCVVNQYLSECHGAKRLDTNAEIGTRKQRNHYSSRLVILTSQPTSILSCQYYHDIWETGKIYGQ
jgi:hypothetical protein